VLGASDLCQHSDCYNGLVLGVVYLCNGLVLEVPLVYIALVCRASILIYSWVSDSYIGLVLGVRFVY